jgi:hypothetical protein
VLHFAFGLRFENLLTPLTREPCVPCVLPSWIEMRTVAHAVAMIRPRREAASRARLADTKESSEPVSSSSSLCWKPCPPCPPRHPLLLSPATVITHDKQNTSATVFAAGIRALVERPDGALGGGGSGRSVLTSLGTRKDPCTHPPIPRFPSLLGGGGGSGGSTSMSRFEFITLLFLSF